MSIEVVEFVDLDEVDGKIRENELSTMGGFFLHGMRWKDYLNFLSNDKTKEYAEALRKYIVEHNIRINGQEHQYSESGVPLFSDNTIAVFSFRGWGDIMAAIWSEEEDMDYCYMDFYC